MKRLIYSLLVFTSIVFFTIDCRAQISQTGIPWSFQSSVDIEPVGITELVDIDIPELITKAEKAGGFYKYGEKLPVDFSMENSGKWTILNDGRKIWQLHIKAANAKALSLFFDNFSIPTGGKLFVYRPDKKQVLGAYTEINNHESGILATQLVYGEEFIIEYNENPEPYGKVSFHLNSVGYAFRGVRNPFSQTKDFGDSESCQVNINCSPEGDNWQDQKRGVVRISVVEGGNMGWCSGSLINNTDEDCKPYILSADHCGGSASVSDFNQWVFYFNFESPNCTNPSSGGSLDNQTMSGCTKKANGGNSGNSGSDFLLVICNGGIPDTYEPFYSGWNRVEIPPTSGVSIHHPAGDIKKISAFTTPATSTGWNGSGLNSHWEITWAATTNGHGVTEGGSSGSPLFNQNGLIVGDLTGGGSYCTSPNVSDEYGKLSYSWVTNGTTNDKQLKPWLDPGNTGVSTLEGKNSCTSGGLYANFSATPMTVVAGSGVTFVDLSSGSPTTWHWTFDGGTPASSYSQNPPLVIYNTPGTYNATLEVSSGPYTDDKIRVITVIAPGPPTTDFVGTVTTIEAGEAVSFLDLTTGGPTQWLWTFVGGSPSTSTDQNPVGITFNTPGVYAVSLYTSNAYGNDTETKQMYITVTEQIPDILYCDTVTNMLPFDSIMVLPVAPYGYLPGHNSFQISEYADHFMNFEGYNKLAGLIVPVVLSNSSLSEAKVRFSVWDGGEVPGNQLAYKDIKINQMYPNFVKLVSFDPPIDITEDYYVGYQLYYYIGDNYSGSHNFAAGIAKDRGNGAPTTLFAKYSNQWRSVDSLVNFSYIHTSLSIEPIVCNPQDIETIQLSTELVVYPNPSNGNVLVYCADFPLDIKYVKVTDLLGNALNAGITSESSNLLELNLTSCNPGFYFVTIIVNGDKVVRKISILK